MNIYFFIKDISLTGGTERVTVNLANLFAQKGYNVTIVSYYHGKDVITYSPSSKVNVVYLVEDRCPDEGNWLTRLKFFFQAITSMRMFFRDKLITKNDILISQNLFSNTIIWLTGKAANTIGCEHFKYDVYPRFVRLFRLFVYRHLQCVVTLTDKDRNRFIRHLKSEKTATIANMVIAKDGVEANKYSTNMIAIGRLAPQKGFDMLIDAMKIVHQRYENWVVNIFGEGEHKVLLQNRIDEFGLNGIVNLKGYTSNLEQEYNQSSFYIMSSRYEGFPLSLLEALSYGMPCLSFDCPEGPSQLLELGGGKLLPFNVDCDKEKSKGYEDNVNTLVHGIIYMIEHPEFREQCIGHKDIIKQMLSPDVIYKKWHDLFVLLGKF